MLLQEPAVAENGLAGWLRTMVHASSQRITSRCWASKQI